MSISTNAFAAVDGPRLTCPSVTTNSSENVMYSPSASNFANQNNLVVTYRYTNQAANRINQALSGNFITAQTPHQLTLPPGQNVVTVTASSRPPNTESAECIFTYFRTSK